MVITIVILYFNKYDVFFIDSVYGEQYKIATVYFHRDEITIKEKWLDDFNEYEKSGIILIDGSNEYSVFPYSQTNFIQDDPTWGLIETKYNEVNSNSKLLKWVKKDSKLNIEVYIHNSRHIWVAVDKTTTSQTSYGRGIYSAPVYDDNGTLIDTLLFAEYNSAGVLEGFANNIPSYVLQQFTYCDVDITDENGTY